MKKIHSRHKRRSKMRTKIMTYCDCNGWWFRGNLLAKKKNCPGILFFNEEKEAPTPPPERMLGPVFATKIGVVSPMTAAMIHQGASVAPWKIAPMASLSCWAFRANRICRQIWFDKKIACFNWNGFKKVWRFLSLSLLVDILNYMVFSGGKREKQRSKHVAAGEHQGCQCHPNSDSSSILSSKFSWYILYLCIFGYIKMWHPTIKRQVGLDHSFGRPKTLRIVAPKRWRPLEV